jgi:rRNA-processing protein FCF1
LINFQAVFTLGFKSLREQLRFVSEKLPYEELGRYIGSFQNKSTTSSVILELDHWVRKTDRSGRMRIWSLIYEEFQRMGMAEQTVKLLDMPLDLVARCGPTDVGLLTLAQQQSVLDPVVLTIDQELRSECLRAEIRAVDIHEIIGRAGGIK